MSTRTQSIRKKVSSDKKRDNTAAARLATPNRGRLPMAVSKPIAAEVAIDIAAADPVAPTASNTPGTANTASAVNTTTAASITTTASTATAASAPVTTTIAPIAAATTASVSTAVAPASTISITPINSATTSSITVAATSASATFPAANTGSTTTSTSAAAMKSDSESALTITSAPKSADSFSAAVSIANNVLRDLKINTDKNAGNNVKNRTQKKDKPQITEEELKRREDELKRRAEEIEEREKNFAEKVAAEEALEAQVTKEVNEMSTAAVPKESLKMMKKVHLRLTSNGLTQSLEKTLKKSQAQQLAAINEALAENRKMQVKLAKAQLAVEEASTENMEELVQQVKDELHTAVRKVGKNSDKVLEIHERGETKSIWGAGVSTVVALTIFGIVAWRTFQARIAAAYGTDQVVSGADYENYQPASNFAATTVTLVGVATAAIAGLWYRKKDKVAKASNAASPSPSASTSAGAPSQSSLEADTKTKDDQVLTAANPASTKYIVSAKNAVQEITAAKAKRLSAVRRLKAVLVEYSPENSPEASAIPANTRRLQTSHLVQNSAMNTTTTVSAPITGRTIYLEENSVSSLGRRRTDSPLSPPISPPSATPYSPLPSPTILAWSNGGGSIVTLAPIAGSPLSATVTSTPVQTLAATSTTSSAATSEVASATSSTPQTERKVPAKK